jgi:hypothetical protein
LGHHAEQRIEAADLFGAFCCSSLAQHRKAELDNMREAIRGFSTCAGGSVTVSHHIAVRNELRLWAIGKSGDGARRRCYLSHSLTLPAGSCGD